MNNCIYSFIRKTIFHICFSKKCLKKTEEDHFIFKCQTSISLLVCHTFSKIVLKFLTGMFRVKRGNICINLTVQNCPWVNRQ